MGLFSSFVRDVLNGTPLFHDSQATEDARNARYPDSNGFLVQPERAPEPPSDNCDECGGDGRSGGEASYSTMNSSCPSCGGTGKK